LNKLIKKECTDKELVHMRLPQFAVIRVFSRVISPMTLIVMIYGIFFYNIYYRSYQYLFQLLQRDEYSYCYLFPFLCGYFLYHKRHEFLSFSSQPSWTGAYPFLFGGFLYWLGELGGEFYSLILSSWFLLIGILWLFLGFKKLKTIGFPLILLALTLPFPNFIYNLTTMYLRLVSSKVGVLLIQIIGIPAYREGNVIDVGVGQLQVADACSGLNSFISLIVLSILYTYSKKSAFWKKALVVASSIPLSVLGNSVRIAVTAWLYVRIGPEVADGFFHTLSGMITFAVVFILLLILSYCLELIPFPKTATVTLEQPDGPRSQPVALTLVSDHDDRSGTALNSWLSLVSSPKVWGTLLLLFGTAYFSSGIDFIHPPRKSFDQFPDHINGWVGRKGRLEQKFIDNLKFTDYLLSDYVNANGDVINIYVAYYENQKKGATVHSPATCMTGTGWTFEESCVIRVPLNDSSRPFLNVNRAIALNSNNKVIAYYWFPQRGRNITSFYLLKAYAFLDAMIKRRTDGALVRMIIRIEGSDETDVAEAGLQEFVRMTDGLLREYIPE
jgi:exosortase D (VPLPA-CTERM-specific)